VQPYDEVRVIRLLRSPDTYDGWGFNQHPPRIGEVGALIDILSRPGMEDRYVVESCQPDGITVWLSEFSADELAPTHAAEPSAAADDKSK